MESICKIIIAILWGMIFFHSFGCVGQNIYHTRNIYYNMDTMKCVDKDVRFWDRNRLNSNAGNPDSSGLYCIFKKNIDIPIVTVNDDNIIHLIDSCLFGATKNDNLQFPDSSGYFVELHIFGVAEDSLMLGIGVAPYSNYYMAEVLSSYRDDVFYEWYGYKEKELLGCFFMNNIICVISYQGWVDYKRVSCIFSKTESTITLALFSPVIMKVTKNTRPECYYYFNACSSPAAEKNG